MSQFKPYPAYKNSGVEWLGEVPEHWEVTPLKYEAEFVNGAAFKPEQWSETGTPIIRIENLNGSLNFNCFDGEMDARYNVEQGDLLFGWSGNRGTSFGPSIWPHEGLYYLNQHIFRVCNFRFDKSWFYWSLKAVTAHVEEQAHGIIGMVHITKGDLGSIKIATPALGEQQAIATYLDHETARIDALIEEQQRLIELLKEKRQAVISHAVTKGLDPTVPMKDSGVEWLGEVPAHWEIKRLQYLCSDIKAGPFGSALTKDMYVADGYKIYGQEQVIPADFGVGDYYIDHDLFSSLKQYEVVPGDVLISCVGTFGKIAVVPEGVEVGIINPRLIRLRANDLISPNYLSTVLRSEVVFEQFSLLSRGGTMDVINIGTLSEIVLALPPIAEQAEILSFLHDQTSKFDGLVDQADQGVLLLQERRSALISAAVTGKIDLRGWQPPADTPAPIREQETV